MFIVLQTEDTNYATMEITDIQVNSPNDMSEIEAIKPIILSSKHWNHLLFMSLRDALVKT